jgi:hypothetical protein
MREGVGFRMLQVVAANLPAIASNPRLEMLPLFFRLPTTAPSTRSSVLSSAARSSA